MLVKILIALLAIIALHHGTENPDLKHSPAIVTTVGGSRPMCIIVDEQKPTSKKNDIGNYPDWHYPL